MTLVRTVSGRDVDLRNPDPATITISDIAHHLSLINRFCGATRTPYSVAQHSILVAGILEDRDCSDRTVLGGLLHDAHEAYIGDFIRPVKAILGVRPSPHGPLDVALYMKLGLQLGSEERREIDHADNTALAMEWRDLMTGAPPASIAAYSEFIPLQPRPKPIAWFEAVAVFIHTFNRLAERCGITTEE